MMSSSGKVIVRPSGWALGFFLLALALLVASAPSLLAAGANNVASVRLAREGEAVSPEELSACRRRVDRSQAAGPLAWALRLDTNLPRAIVNQGRVAWLEGRCDEAVLVWGRALSLNSRDITAWALYLAAGGDILPSDPTVAEGLAAYFLYLGDQDRKAEQWEGALEWYAMAFSVHPSREAAGRLEAAYLRLERKDAAVAVWEELAALLPPSDPDHWWAMGWLAELAQEWEQAALAYREGAARAEEPVPFWIREGEAWGRVQRWEAVEMAYERIIQARPDGLTGYLYMGHLRQAQKDYAAALAWYRRADAVAGGNWVPQYYQGVVYYQMEQYPQAEERFRAVLAAQPEHLWSLYYLAQAVYRQGRLAEAVDYLARAITLHTGQPWEWAVQLGDWRAEAGDVEGALAAYQQALAWRPGDENIQGKIQALQSRKSP